MIADDTIPEHSGYSLEGLVQLLTNHPPWWVYVVAALIPLSILYVMREGCCWFWKMNRAIDTLERIERHLEHLGRTNSALRSPESDDRPFTNG